MAPLRVALVDDHNFLRLGLKALLETCSDMTVVVDAASAEDAMEQLAVTSCDVVALDVSMPGTDGLTCLRWIKERHPEVPVLIVSMHADESVVRAAVGVGADGYIVKSASWDEFRRALLEVSNGGVYFHAKIAQVIRSLGKRGRAQGNREALTLREWEVLRLVAEGLGNGEIARRLVLSIVTIKGHLRSIYGKLSVKDRTQAALWAVSHANVEPNPPPVRPIGQQPVGRHH